MSANTSFKLKVVGLKAAGGAVVGTAISRPFTVGALRVALPNGKERIEVGAVYRVTWQVAPGKTVTGGRLSLSQDGGVTWKLQKGAAAVYAPGRFTWTVPAVAAASTRCRVKVELYDGTTLVGTDTSNANFTIVPD